MLEASRVMATAQLVTDDDYLQLSRLVIEHAWRADHGRADTVHELYADDAEVDAFTVRGQEAIRDWGRKIADAPPWRTIRHVCGNMRFVKRGPDEAEGITVMTVFMAEGDEAATTLPFRVGEDHDRFVRTKDGWRFLQRRQVELFSAT